MPPLDQMDIGLDLPDELSTQININRWLSGWNNDLEKIRSLLGTYVENRKAANFAEPPLWQNFLDHPYVQKVAPFMRLSIRPMVINEFDNSIVVINRLGDINHHDVALSVTSSELILFYFAAAEYFFQQVLEQERRTGCQSGVTLIYDYADLQLLDYINPYSPAMQLFSLGAMMLQEYYCEMLKSFYLVNTGSWIKPLLQLTKTVLKPRTMSKVHIVGCNQVEESLRERISKNALPIAYGGEWFETDPNVHPETCVWLGKPVTDKLFYKPSKNFPQKLTVHIRPKKQYKKEISVQQAGQYLSWQFVTSSKVLFAVTHEDKLVFPRILLCTPHGNRLPEEGSVPCKTPGKYYLEFTNTSALLFSIRVDFAYRLC